MTPNESTDRPTGDQLLDELRAAAQAAGLPLTTFIKPIVISKAQNFIEQLGRSGRPLPATVARVRALLAGAPIPPARPSPFKGCTGQRKTHVAAAVRISEAEYWRRRGMADAARAARLPGETLEAAIKRISQGGDQ